jgi:cytochrome P450
LRAEYGPVATFPVWPRLGYLINEPDLIEEILIRQNEKFSKGRALEVGRVLLGDGLLTSVGELHKRQRRLIQPVFTKTRLAGYSDAIVRIAAEHGASWRDGAHVDMQDECSGLMVHIAAEVMFGARLGVETRRSVDAMKIAFEVFGQVLNPAYRILNRLPLPRNRRILAACLEVDRVVMGFIERCKADADPSRADFLSILIRAQEQDQNALSDRQLRDECVTMFLAGHETTSVALMWTWYALSQHPEIEERFHDELDRVIGNRLPRHDDIELLSYTRMMLNEVLRLYPPAYLIGRRALEDVIIGSYLIKKGSLVTISPYFLHRDSRFFDDAETFNPDRWAGGTPDALPKFAYLPFAAGPRSCIGEAFARTELTLALATLARSWKAVATQQLPLLFKRSLTLRPNNGMPMLLCSRSRKS